MKTTKNKLFKLTFSEADIKEIQNYYGLATYEEAENKIHMWDNQGLYVWQLHSMEPKLKQVVPNDKLFITDQHAEDIDDYERRQGLI